MKKVLFISILAVLCFSCTKAPQELVVKTIAISAYSGDGIQIEAVSDYNITYLTSNAYVADVSSKGLVTANRIGESQVEVLSYGTAINVDVDIKAKYDTYPDPIIDFTMTRFEIIEKLGEPDENTNSVITYHNYSDKAPEITYLFNQDETLMCSMVHVYSIYKDELRSYMEERFVFDEEEGELTVYMNALSGEEASVLIGIFDFGGGDLMVLYIENQEVQSKSSKSLSLDPLRKQLEALKQEYRRQ